MENQCYHRSLHASVSDVLQKVAILAIDASEDLEAQVPSPEQQRDTASWSNGNRQSPYSTSTCTNHENPPSTLSLLTPILQRQTSLTTTIKNWSKESPHFKRERSYGGHYQAHSTTLFASAKAKKSRSGSGGFIQNAPHLPLSPELDMPPTFITKRNLAIIATPLSFTVTRTNRDLENASSEPVEPDRGALMAQHTQLMPRLLTYSNHHQPSSVSSISFTLPTRCSAWMQSSEPRQHNENCSTSSLLSQTSPPLFPFSPTEPSFLFPSDLTSLEQQNDAAVDAEQLNNMDSISLMPNKQPKEKDRAEKCLTFLQPRFVSSKVKAIETVDLVASLQPC